MINRQTHRNHYVSAFFLCAIKEKEDSNEKEKNEYEQRRI